ncbi:MAG: ribonuclease R [Bacilli bacterium]
MKDQILNILNEKKQALTENEIFNKLNLDYNKEELKERLNDLEKEGLIYKTKKEKFVSFENSHLKKGFLTINQKGIGYVLMENEPDIRIDISNLNGAIHGDLVMVNIINQGIGRIVKIIKREIGVLVGEYYTKRGIGYIKLDDNKYKLDIRIAFEDSNGAVDGHKVLVELIKEINKTTYQGQVLKIIGHKNDPGIDIRSIIYEYGFDDAFSNDVCQELKNIPLFVSEEEMKNRRDLRQEKIFTIDGDDAKDLDDAISIKELKSGNYLLGIHISDVDYYLKGSSEIDKEALERGTSVYLVNQVVPMLPPKLSNGVCSLNEKVDRLTITCEMEIDKEGQVVNYDIYESVINSKKRMTYNDVNNILENNKKIEGYEEFIWDLKIMKRLAFVLREVKEKRGYLDFDLDEMKIIVNDEGKPIDVLKDERGIGEKIIEDFMIIANETVASHIFNLDLPFIYRIHERPKEAKINNFFELISLFGYRIKGKRKISHPKFIQRILGELKNKKEFMILSNLLLRSMQKARYESKNLGHYGLASRCYTHFTAPIRRYPDRMVHRLLRMYLFKKDISNKNITYLEKYLLEVSEHSSLKERKAIDCERAVLDMKAAEYMENHLGEKYYGTIVNIMNFGMFVQLDNLIEGLIKVSDMKDDYYYFDEKTLSFIGRRFKKRYRLGDKILIEVKGASKETKNIDFKIAEKKIKGK